MRRIVWESGAWLFLGGGGAYPNGGVRVTVSIPFSTVEYIEGVFPLAAAEYSAKENN